MQAENNSSYWTKIKFYRVVFVTPVYGHGFNLGGDSGTNEYYNCVFKPAVGGWNGGYSNAQIKTYNCIFQGGANGYYSGNPLKGVAENCASTTTVIDPANGTKTTCLTNVQIDSDYNLKSGNWEHAGTGQNPDGTQANIGVYGGEFSW